MIETLFSLKMCILLFIGTLIVGEMFVTLQTAETDNFFALRAYHVHQNSTQTDQFFNDHVMSKQVFGFPGSIIQILPLQTRIQKNGEIQTIMALKIPFRFDGDDQFYCMGATWKHPQICTSVQGFQVP